MAKAVTRTDENLKWNWTPNVDQGLRKMSNMQNET